MPKVFREFGNFKQRQQWPVQFDLEGVERDNQVRQQKLQEFQFEESMPAPLSANSFVGGASIDLNNPPKVNYNPFDPKNEFPKMLYHKSKKDPNWTAEYKRLELHNALHPQKPEILPIVPPMFIVVKSREEEVKMLASGFQLKPPAVAKDDEELSDDDGEALCSRGCGNAPHRGFCKAVAVTA